MVRASAIREEFYTVTIARDATAAIVAEMWQIDQETVSGSARKVLHRDGMPAWTKRDPTTGIITSESWCKNGQPHRDDGPAKICRDPKTGVITKEEWFQNGKRYRNGGPAVIYRRAETGDITYTRWFPQRGAAALQELHSDHTQIESTPSPG